MGFLYMQRFLWDQLSPFYTTVFFYWSFCKALNHVPHETCALSVDQWHDQSVSSLCFHDTVLALLCVTETHRFLNTNASYCRLRQKNRSNYNPCTALPYRTHRQDIFEHGPCRNTGFLPRKFVSLQPAWGWGIEKGATALLCTWK